MFIRIPGDTLGDRAEYADYADRAESFETLEAALDGLDSTIGWYDTATILDARSHPVHVAARAEGFVDRRRAERVMIQATAIGGTATVTASDDGFVMVWRAA